MENKLKNFWETYRGKYFFLVACAFILHGARGNTTAIGIDTEAMLWMGNMFYGGWLNTGRQGLFLIKWLTGCIELHPYFAQMMTLLLCGTAVFCWLFMWEQLRHSDEKAGWFPWILGGLMFISHPVLAEAVYFTLQSAEIFLGMIMIVGALFLIEGYKANHRKGIWRLILSSVITCWTFCIYQSFESVFIVGCVSILFVQGLEKIRRKEHVTAKELLGSIPKYFAVFIVAFVINMIITKLYFGASTYLQNTIMWGKFPLRGILYMIVRHGVQTLTGWRSVHYHFSFGLLYLLCLVSTIVILVKRKPGKKVVWAMLFLQVALLSTPYLMTVLLGNSAPIRSQMVLPIMVCLLGYLMNFHTHTQQIADNQKKRIYIGYGICALVCMTGIFYQTRTTLDLYYTDQCRYEQDVALGRALIERLDEVTGGERYPVAVIGKKTFSTNRVSLLGETIGRSFFEHDAEVEPLYFYSNARVLGFLYTLGGDYSRANLDQVNEALYYSVNMPDWPAEGSVAMYNGIVVVRLSDPNE